MGDLRCPTCEYDLRGLHVAGGRLRCPECGGRVGLHELAGLVVERRRRSREITQDLLLFLVLSPLVFLTIRLLEHVPLREVTGVRIEGLLSVTGLLLTAYLAIALFLASSLGWEDLHPREQWLYAAVAAVLVVLFAASVSLPAAAVLLAGWTVAFRWITKRFEL